MSGTHTDVPSLLAHDLPRPVPSAEHDACPVGDVFRRFGDKWSLLLVALLGARPHRYNELHRAVEGISQRMLTRTLRSLETDGLVQRDVHPTVPPSVEYRLTPLGRTLLVPLSALADWAVQHGPAMAENRTRRPGAPPSPASAVGGATSPSPTAAPPPPTSRPPSSSPTEA
ncbi:winged helix-turn-helix transcriptional regulator [Actinomadura parmotrematis]|uniref:Helix-turn-helix transcriptional regulator n=1 Tax=Actinomadura parmotrematis TaxID=2864039 RepID=A0ABS7FQU1_9ACTN|nr:helix-turn-helix domain-containing protein [Actinomadura parmotrematis]MBW8481913.1 helix-turn-helix transcriptional regulator [Actinomadura parmotrematis]